MKINIIGSGFAGLSAAATLASKGYKVQVFEKNEMPGGRSRKLEINEFRFDMGPTWYWMPDVFEKFFNRFGRKVSELYELKRVTPGYRMFFGSEDFIDIPAEIAHLLNVFESIEKGSAAKLRRFLEKAKNKYDIGIGRMVYLPGNSFTELLTWDFLRSLPKLEFFKSVSHSIRSEFKDHRLRHILEFPVLFLGATPQKIPALYTLMNYADLCLGTWYPVGGMYSVVEAIQKIAVENGAEFFMNSQIEKIIVEGGMVKGIRVNGEIYYSDVVIGAADYHHVEQKLLDKSYRIYSENYWNKRTMAPSALLYFIGINKKLSGLQHHNLFFDESFENHAREIYVNPVWPSKPAIYVSCNSISDPQVAPEGKDNLIVLVPVAAGLKDSEEIRDNYYDLVIERIEKNTRQNIKDYVIFKKSYAHNDFVNDYYSFRGNAYGLANTLMQTAFLKPKLRNPYLKNLFYAGQLTVPGPGVPSAIISGQVVAEEINKYFKSEEE